MIRVLIALLILGAAGLAAAEGDEELFLLSYEIEKAGKPLASPAVLVRADQLGCISIDEGEASSLKLTFWVSTGKYKTRVSTLVTSRDIDSTWEGWVDCSQVQEFGVNDVRIRFKVERHVAGEA